MQTVSPLAVAAHAQPCLCQTKPQRVPRSKWKEGALPEVELGGPLMEERPHFFVAAARLLQG
eukprot:scaffold155725_cov20-Tisochrysis_lutea.AAC.1